MADDPKKPKVGVYDDDKEVAEKSGGIPSWAIALIVVVLIILAIILFF